MILEGMSQSELFTERHPLFFLFKSQAAGFENRAFTNVPVRFTIHGILTGTILKSRFSEASFADLAQANRGDAIGKIHSFSNVPIRLLTNPFLIGTLS